MGGNGWRISVVGVRCTTDGREESTAEAGPTVDATGHASFGSTNWLPGELTVYGKTASPGSALDSVGVTAANRRTSEDSGERVAESEMGRSNVLLWRNDDGVGLTGSIARGAAVALFQLTGCERADPDVGLGASIARAAADLLAWLEGRERTGEVGAGSNRVGKATRAEDRGRDVDSPSVGVKW